MDFIFYVERVILLITETKYQSENDCSLIVVWQDLNVGITWTVSYCISFFISAECAHEFLPCLYLLMKNKQQYMLSLLN